jgi:hypothetical protein
VYTVQNAISNNGVSWRLAGPLLVTKEHAPLLVLRQPWAKSAHRQQKSAGVFSGWVNRNEILHQGETPCASLF